MVKIALDAGHGKDTYPPSKGVPKMSEYEFNSGVVKYTKDLAKLNNLEVVLTQGLNHNDTPLNKRTKKADNENVDVILSFHADYNHDPNAKGHWVFYWQTDSSSQKLAKIWDKYAERILPNPSRGVIASKEGAWSNFHMTRVPSKYYNIPSILIEHGFMSNDQDLELLLSNDFRKKCAKVAIKTICDYFELEFKSPEEEGDNMSKYFNDVPQDHWGADDADEAYEEGLVSGVGNGNLNPEDNITRIESIVLLNRLRKYLLNEIHK